MSINVKTLRSYLITAFCALAASFAPAAAYAHCDSLDGPVLVEAKVALEKRDVTPLLKWIPERDEEEIKLAFQKTLILGDKGEDVKEMAQMYFFETLVRIHRAGEGFAYTGIRATSRDAGPAVLGADQALKLGCSQHLTSLVTDAVTEGILRRFEHVLELKAKAETSVEAGREYVAAYVDYVHYVEGMYSAAERKATHNGEGEPSKDENKTGCGHK